MIDTERSPGHIRGKGQIQETIRDRFARASRLFPIANTVFKDGGGVVSAVLGGVQFEAKERLTMRTSEDASESGLYASECCFEELIYCEGDTVGECPRCCRLCQWVLLETVVSAEQLDRWDHEITRLNLNNLSVTVSPGLP
jgi:hypothetical protein